MAIPAVIEAYIAAYNARDVDRMLDCLAEDIVFRNLSAGQVTAEAIGKPSFAQMAHVGAAAFTTRRQVVRHAITVADTTLVEIDYTATVAADLPNGWKAGQNLAFAGASLFRVRSGQIVEIIDQS